MISEAFSYLPSISFSFVSIHIFKSRTGSFPSWCLDGEQEKIGKKSSWYKRGGDEAVIFVPATPNSQLQKKYQTEIKRQSFKIKVVKKAGVAIKRLLQKCDSFKPRGNVSEKTAQYVGRGRGGGGGPFNKENVTYKIKCIGCNNVYVGETSRSAYTRGKRTLKVTRQ